MALGLTQQLPVDEKHNYSRDYLNDRIAILLGGRIAEDMMLGQVTTGAGNDLERATEMARSMVCEWGMSDAMGPLTFGKKEEQIFLGREIAQRSDYSEDTAIRIDHEVKRIVLENYHRATEILQANRARLERMADELLAREVLDGEQVRRIVADLELDDVRPARPSEPAAAPVVDDRVRARDQRPAIVPPLNKPLPQE
jgi:cell division protease FtsH